MTDLDREQLKRDCTDPLDALTKAQRLDGLAELADTLRTLGPPYQFHGELILGAVRDGQERDHVAPDPGARESWRRTRRGVHRIEPALRVSEGHAMFGVTIPMCVAV